MNGKIGEPRGVLRAAPGDGVFEHERRPPPAELAGFIEHFWRVAWEVPGEPVRRQVLSHPSVHVVLSRDDSHVTGVPRGLFTRWLAGIGRVFGIKFRPGAFRPLVGHPVSQLTDRELPIEDVLGERGLALADAVLAEPTWDAQIETAVAQLRELLPPRDPVADQVAALVQQILDDREICKVDDLVRRCGRSARTLQRLFGDYVGVSPKWVIQRYRLHEAVARIHGGGADWAAMALELGYFDQAHFIRDFKAVVGRTPRKYGAEEPPGTAPAIGPPRRRAGS